MVGSYGNKNSKKGGKKKTAENSELKVDVKKPGENSKKTKGEVEKEEVEEKRRIGCPFDQVPVELMTDVSFSPLSRRSPLLGLIIIPPSLLDPLSCQPEGSACIR